MSSNIADSKSQPYNSAANELKSLFVQVWFCFLKFPFITWSSGQISAISHTNGDRTTENEYVYHASKVVGNVLSMKYNGGSIKPT